MVFVLAEMSRWLPAIDGNETQWLEYTMFTTRIINAAERHVHTSGQIWRSVIIALLRTALFVQARMPLFSLQITPAEWETTADRYGNTSILYLHIRWPHFYFISLSSFYNSNTAQLFYSHSLFQKTLFFFTIIFAPFLPSLVSPLCQCLSRLAELPPSLEEVRHHLVVLGFSSANGLLRYYCRPPVHKKKFS